MRSEIYSERRRWFWRIYGLNGPTVATCGPDGYGTYRAAWMALARLVLVIHGEDLVMPPKTYGKERKED